MNITFRTDASLQIGTGHVMRCLALASVLRDYGAECRFICREHTGHLLNLIRRQGFEAFGLPLQNPNVFRIPETDIQPLAHAAWLGTDWVTDAEQTKICIGEIVTDWLIVDHYALDFRWESVMRRQCRNLMVIDDIADRRHDCDLLLDQNLFSNMTERYIGKVPTHCGLMLGPKYALLQPLYKELHPRTPLREGAIHRILVYFGGSDANNLTSMTVAAYLALEREDIVLDVVINPSNPQIETLHRQIQGRTNITIHEGLPSLAPLMVQADLSVGAGGSTSWERCCLGLPSIIVTLAANQIPIARELDRLGLVQWIGDVSEVSESRLVNALGNLCSTGLDSGWSGRCRQKVDGGGAERVAGVLLLNAQTKLKARLARLDDEALMLQWANDCLMRGNTFFSDSIDKNTYRSCFRNYLRNLECCRLYVIETESGMPIGLVRFEIIDGRWELNYLLDILLRGYELRKELLQSALQAFRTSMTGVLLFGRLQTANQALSGVFKCSEFSYKNEEKGPLSIVICSDANSWINPYLPELLLAWLVDGHSVAWTHSACDLPVGDICFYLSYGRIVDAPTRARFKNNLVIHESDLPRGRGWSPMSWLILNGENRIPVTLLEAGDQVDAGCIYLQEWIELSGNELSYQWRQLQADSTRRLCQKFVYEYPSILNQARSQEGEAFFYPRRGPGDSELNPNKTLADQFNLLRVVDNENYPAYFDLAGKIYFLRVKDER